MADFGTAVFTAILNNSQLIGGVARTNTALGSIGSTFSRIGGALTQGVTVPLVGLAVVGVRTAVLIDDAWNEVRKTYNAIPAEIERQIAPTGLLGQAVTGLSIKYGLAREEVIGVLGKISALGMTGPAAVSALTIAVEFATAAGIDFNRGLDVSIALASTFSLTGAALNKALYGLNQVENETAANGEDLSIALSRAGGAAAALVNPAFTADQAIAAIASGMAVFKKAGQETFRSADALRAIFQRLYLPSKKVQVLFDKMGVSVNDAKGNLVPFPTLLQNIAGNFDKLTQSEKLAFSKQSIGVEFGPLFNTLIQDIQKGTKSGDESLSTFLSTLNKYGDTAAGQAAYTRELKVQQESLSASFGRVKAAFGLLIDTGSPFIKSVIQPLTQHTADLITKFAKMSPHMQRMGVLFAVIAAAAGPVLLIIGAIISILGALISGPVLAVLAAVALAFALLKSNGVSLGKAFSVVSGYVRGFITYMRQIVATIMPKVMPFVKVIGQNLTAAFKSLFNVVRDVMPVLKVLAVIVGAVLLVAITTLSYGLRGLAIVFEFVANIIGAVARAIIAVFTWLYNLLIGGSIIPDLVNGAIFFFNLMASVIVPIVKVMVAVISAVIRTLAAIFRTVFGAIQAVVTAVWPVISAIVTAAVAVIVAVVKAGMAVIKAVWTAAWWVISNVLLPIFNAIKTAVTAVINFIKSVITGGLGVIKAVWSAAWNVMKTVVSSVFGAIKTVVSGGINAVKGVVSTGVNAVKSGWTAGWNALSSVTSSVMGKVRSAASTGINGVKSVMGSTMSAISGAWSSAWGGIRDFISNVMERIKSIIQGALGFINGVVDRIGGAISKVTGAIGKVAGAAGKVGSIVGGIFGSGGLVPGSGNRDTYPALLTPGEFVLSKKAVAAVGVDRLAEVNAAGGNANRVMEDTATKALLVRNAVQGASNASKQVQGALQAVGIGRRGVGLPVNRPGGEDSRDQSVTIHTVINNPLPERSSDALNNRMVRIAQLGLLTRRGD